MEQQSFIQVEQVNHPMMGFSGTTVCFIFTNLCFLFWASLLGVLGEGAILAIGLIQLGVVIAYHLAASKVFARGQAFDGNVFLVFATFFGGVGGLSNIAAAIAPIIGIPYEGTAVGYCWVMCGIFLIPQTTLNFLIIFALSFVKPLLNSGSLLFYNLILNISTLTVSPFRSQLLN